MFKFNSTTPLFLLTLIISGCGAKEDPPELMRAKQLIFQFNCETHDGEYEKFMEENKSRAKGVIRIYEEKGINMSNKSIDWSVENYLDQFKTECKNSNDAVKRREKK